MTNPKTRTIQLPENDLLLICNCLQSANSWATKMVHDQIVSQVQDLEKQEAEESAKVLSEKIESEVQNRLTKLTEQTRPGVCPDIDPLRGAKVPGTELFG